MVNHELLSFFPFPLSSCLVSFAVLPSLPPLCSSSSSLESLRLTARVKKLPLLLVFLLPLQSSLHSSSPSQQGAPTLAPPGEETDESSLSPSSLLFLFQPPLSFFFSFSQRLRSFLLLLCLALLFCSSSSPSFLSTSDVFFFFFWGCRLSLFPPRKEDWEEADEGLGRTGEGREKLTVTPFFGSSFPGESSPWEI